MRNVRFICCITHVLIDQHYIHMSVCDGEDMLKPTHCRYCEYWRNNQPEDEEEESEE